MGPPSSNPDAIDLRKAIGRQYSVPDTVASATDMAAYARATDDLNPRYLEGDVVAPPLFAVRLFHPLISVCCGDPELDLDMLRLVHGEQDMTWFDAIRPGELVQLTGILESVAQKKTGCIVAWRLRASVAAAPRVEARLSVFVRGQSLPGVPDGAVFGAVPKGGVGQPDGLPEMISTNLIDPSHPGRYAEASGDNNPIHLDESVAQAAGLPTVILHGLCTMAMAVAGVVDESLGGDASRLRRVAVRFSRPVLPGHEITTQLFSSDARPEGRNAYHLVTKNQDGDVVIARGWVEVDA
jgi:acyl dehydratase